MHTLWNILHVHSRRWCATIFNAEFFVAVKTLETIKMSSKCSMDKYGILNEVKMNKIALSI